MTRAALVAVVVLVSTAAWSQEPPVPSPPLVTADCKPATQPIIDIAELRAAIEVTRKSGSSIGLAGINFVEAMRRISDALLELNCRIADLERKR